MTTTTCTHPTTRTIATHGYTGGVATSEDYVDRRAHGCVHDTDECEGCGARRSVLRNQRWEETGPWGPTRAQREAHARRLVDVARKMLAAVGTERVAHADGRTLTLSVDREGYVVVTGAPHTTVEADAAALAASEWLDRARTAREAVREAEYALAEVAS